MITIRQTTRSEDGLPSPANKYRQLSYIEAQRTIINSSVVWNKLDMKVKLWLYADRNVHAFYSDCMAATLLILQWIDWVTYFPTAAYLNGCHAF